MVSSSNKQQQQQQQRNSNNNSNNKKKKNHHRFTQDDHNNNNNDKDMNNYDDDDYENDNANNNNFTNITKQTQKSRMIIQQLEQRIQQEGPARGTLPYPKHAVVAFASLPLSPETLKGLTIPKSQKAPSFTTLTEIQKQTIPHALMGRDILGAAQTGSGKTLAFGIPVLEKLYRSSWTRQDGIGAIILSPTRELAGQIYAVLQLIGRYHSNLTMGLVIGGQNKNKQKQKKSIEEATQFQKEQYALPNTNILICTPGRLLQHLEQTPYLNIENTLQILVLDEADRILDMGFRDALLRILDYLPSTSTNRQTLLFSATQTKTVQDLAILSIQKDNVEYIGISNVKALSSSSKKDDNNNNDKEHGMTTSTTDTTDPTSSIPTVRLKQFYVVVPIQHKLNCIYSFIKSHLQSKMIVFASSCAQVRFVWELFCQLRPGISILAIHGKLSQIKRLGVYDKFANAAGGGSGNNGGGNSGAVLFATDVAARGLDFPNVDWVIQMDAPETMEMYIHRVGRTARFQSKGQSLLLIDPIEEQAMFGNANNNTNNSKDQQSSSSCCWKIDGLKKKVINPTKTMLVTQRAASLLAEQSSRLPLLAKKAFCSYVRSLLLLPKNDATNWQSMNISKFDWSAFATSLGLSSTPSKLESLLKLSSTSSNNNDNDNAIMSRDELRATKNVNRKLQKLKQQIQKEKEEKKKQREEEMKQKKKKRKVEDNDNDKKDKEDDAEEEEDDLLIFKARHEAGGDTTAAISTTTTTRHSKKIRIDGGGGGGDNNDITTNSNSTKHIVFNEDGTAMTKPKLLSSIIVANNNNKDDNILAPLDKDLLQQENLTYVQKIQQRLQSNQELDKQQERQRIREKHIKKKLQQKIEEQGGEGGEGEIATTDADETKVYLKMENDDNDESSSSSSDSDDSDSDDDVPNKKKRQQQQQQRKDASSSSSSSDSDDSSSSDDDDDNDNTMEDVAAQEDLALSLIRGRV